MCIHLPDWRGAACDGAPGTITVGLDDEKNTGLKKSMFGGSSVGATAPFTVAASLLWNLRHLLLFDHLK